MSARGDFPTAEWGVNYAEVTLGGNSELGSGERRELGSGERRLPPAELNLFAFLFGEPPPDPDVLTGGECPIETTTPHAAAFTDLFGRFDLLQGRSGCPNREKNVRIVDLAAGSVMAPVACGR